MKKLFFFAMILGFLAACNSGKKETEQPKAAQVAVLTFEQQAEGLVDSAVVIEGTVLHTCKHSGKRMFLVDGNDSIRVEITAGKEITKFDEKLVGSRVKVFGILKEERIDEKYLNEWENELKKPQENHEVGVHSGAKGHEDQGVEEKMNQIKALREELTNSGTDHLSFYSVEASRFEEIRK